jgi:hypothetical protein
VEIGLLHTFGVEVTGGRGGFGDVAGWGDVVGSDGVSEPSQCEGVLYLFVGRQCGCDALEKGGIVDVGGVGFPLVNSGVGN